MSESFLLKLLVITTACAVGNEGTYLHSFTLDNFLRGTYQNKLWNGTWISGRSFIYPEESYQFILKFDVESCKANIFFERSVLINYPRANFKVSPDENYLLIQYNTQQVYRYSVKAQYAIYDLRRKLFYNIAEKEFLSIATWSPVSNGLVYVLKNNVYFVTAPENVDKPIQITTDGIEGVIYNGVPDWVYEEEVFESGSTLWFSPSGQTLAFAFFNDSDVESYTYTLYGEPENHQLNYPKLVSVKYPRVGANNPVVNLRIANLENGTSSFVTVNNLVPSKYLPDDYVLLDVAWATDNEISAVVANRIQNKADLRRCNILSGDCKTERKFEEKNGWLELKVPKYSTDGKSYVMILSQPEGYDSFDHLIHSTINGDLTRLTFGSRVVTRIYGWDEKNNVVYYAGSVEKYPSRQQVYVVNLNTLENKCLTCDFLIGSTVKECFFAEAVFSLDFSHVAKVCLGPEPFYVTLENTRNDKELITVVWELNADLLSQYVYLLKPVIKDVDVPLEGGFVAKARMYLPPDFDEYGTKKYPAVVQVYAGPNSVSIEDQFFLGFRDYLVTDRNYIWINIDGRGSGRKGDNIKYAIYRKMGTVEVEDQIVVTKCLQHNFPFIDASNTAIWGWSYGGFVTAWALVKDKEHVFKCGLAIAPVTNFLYYDSIYTERYMGLATAEGNLRGYNNTDLSLQVEAFNNRTFFLIHGNADENVHYQHSMLLARALEYADIQFQQINYPDENHSLGNVSPHLYHSIDHFFAQCFGLKDPPVRRLPKKPPSSKKRRTLRKKP